MNELTLSTALETALNRIEDMLSDNDGQAFKEARKFLPVGRAALAAQPGAVGEPMVVLHDDGYWKPCDTPAGRALNTRLMHAGSHEVIHAAAPTEAKPAQPAQQERVSVPMKPTQAMRDVMDSEGWSWEDLLAAAEAITEAEYAALSTPAQQDAVDAERYRELRRGMYWSVVDAIGDHLRDEALDGDIDAAISAKKGG